MVTHGQGHGAVTSFLMASRAGGQEMSTWLLRRRREHVS